MAKAKTEKQDIKKIEVPLESTIEVVEEVVNEEVHNNVPSEDEIIFSLAKVEKELDDLIDEKLFNLFSEIIEEYKVKRLEMMAILKKYNELESNTKDFKKQEFRNKMGVSKFHLGKRKMILTAVEQLKLKLGVK